MTANKIKFHHTVDNVHAIELHTPATHAPYVRQVGDQSYTAQIGSVHVDVTLSTGCDSIGGDIMSPSPFYELSAVYIDGEETTLDTFADTMPDVYQAAMALVTNHDYPTDPEMYTFTLSGVTEDNHGETIRHATLTEVKAARGYEVVDATLMEDVDNPTPHSSRRHLSGVLHTAALLLAKDGYQVAEVKSHMPDHFTHPADSNHLIITKGNGSPFYRAWVNPLYHMVIIEAEARKGDGVEVGRLSRPTAGDVRALIKSLNHVGYRAAPWQRKAWNMQEPPISKYGDFSTVHKTARHWTLVETIDESEDKFKYSMLDRLRTSPYYFDDARVTADHMRYIWHSLPAGGKPEWVTLEDIDELEARACK